MEKDLIVAIIYTKFHEKLGPTPISWIPTNLPTKIRNIISFKSINVLAGEMNGKPKSLFILPFPSLNMKGLVKVFTVAHTKYRGGINDRTISIIFGEANDLIYYKYIKSFEKIFEMTASKLRELEEGTEEEIQKELEIFYNKMIHILQELYNLEFSDQEIPPFPKRDLDDQNVINYRFKIILCGDEEVGKTSIVLRFTDKAFMKTYIPTIGVNISEKIIDTANTKVEFIIWDIAGRSKFNKMRKHYYHGADGVFFVFDLTDISSFNNIQDWVSDVTYYLGNNIKGILLGNKSDLVKQRKISDNQIMELIKKLNFQYIQTSALTGENIEESFFNLRAILIQN